MQLNQITYLIRGCIFNVHSKLGPGLLESTYELCLAHELTKEGLKFEQQKPLPVVYDGVKLDGGYRIDLLVENKVIIELKAVDAIINIHKAQLLTYLKLFGIELGLLVNFNVTDMRQGITRLILSKRTTY